MAARYVRLVEGFLPSTAKLLKITEDSTDAVVIATGAPVPIQDLAATLNAQAESQVG